MNTDKLLSNKKFLILTAIFVLIAAIVLIVIALPSSNNKTDNTKLDPDFTDDLEHYQLIDDINEYVYNNHPIDRLLPIRNQSPFYYIALIVNPDESNGFSASIEISYYTAEGKAAAKARLQSSEFSAYHPENYKITYTQLTDN